MPTIIDTLALKIVIDDSGLKKGQQEATESVRRSKNTLQGYLKSIDESTRTTAEGFQTISRVATNFFAVLLGARGIREFIEQITMANVQLSNLASRLDIAPQTISAWGAAVERIGGSASEAGQTLSRLNSMFQNWRMFGQLPQANVLAQIATKGGIRINRDDSPEEQMSKLAQDFQNIQRRFGSGAASNLADQIGISPGVLRVMEEQGSNINAHIKSLEKLAPTKEMLQDSNDLLKSWQTLLQTATYFGQVVEEKIAKPLKESVDYVTRIIGGMTKIIQGKETSIHQFQPGHGAWLLDQIQQWWNTPSAPGKPVAPNPNLDTSFFGTLGRGLGNVGSGLWNLIGGTAHAEEATEAHPVPVKVVSASGGGGTSWWQQLGAGIGSVISGASGAVGGVAGAVSRFARHAMGSDINYTPSDDVAPGVKGNLTKLIEAVSAKYHIDPRIMQGIRAGESGHGSRYDVKDDAMESSWGPFQLNRHGGLGNQFEKDTAAIRAKYGFGDLRDPRTIPLQADWVANFIAHGGSLGNWHGYHGPRDDPGWGDSGYRPATGAGDTLSPTSDDGSVNYRGMSNATAGRLRAYEFYHKYMKGAAAAAAMSRQAMLASGSVTTNNTTHHTSVSIGSMPIHTSATDGVQFARDFYDHINHARVASMGNYGAV